MNLYKSAEVYITFHLISFFFRLLLWHCWIFILFYLNFVQLYIEGLCHGNLSEEEAVNISNIFKTNFPVKPLPIKSRHAERVICFPSNANLVRDINVKNKLEKNSVIEVISVWLVVISISSMCSRYNLFSIISNKFLPLPALIFLFMQLYFQIEEDLGLGSTKLKALIDLFDEIVEEPLFNQLRWQSDARNIFFLTCDIY